MVRNGKEAEMRDQSRVGAEVKTSGAGSAPELSFDAPGLAALPIESHLLVARGAAVVVMVLAVIGIGSIALSTSIALLLVGLSLLMSFSKWARANLAVGAMAVVAFAIAAFHLVVYELGLTADSPFPGGTMAPNSAAAILIFCSGQAWISFSGKLKALVLFTSGLTVLGLGLAAIAGHATGVEMAFRWPGSTPMPPLAAVALSLLGAIHLTISRHPALQPSPRLPFLVAILAIPVGFFFDLAAPPYLGAGFIYIPVILSGIWFADRRLAFALATVCGLFSLFGYAAKLQPLDVEQQRLIGRLIGAGTGFIVAALVYYVRHAFEQNDRIRLRFDTLMDNSPDAVVTIDARGLIRHFNPAAERLFGHRQADVVGKNVKLLMPEPYHSAHDGYLKHHTDTGEKHIIGTIREVSGRRADGSIFPLDLSISELPAEGEKEFVGVLRDLSVRKRQEENLRETLGRLAAYAADLERSNQELDEFAYIASHDLKEPLRGIHNHSRFLLEDYAERLDQDGKRRLDRLVHLSQRMEKLVNDLLYFSRIGRFELAIKPTDLTLTLREIVSTLEQFLEERHAKVVVADNLPVVTCDSVRVAEIFRNLIVNAVKYNENAEKIVTVGYLPSHADETGRLRTDVHFVRDNGKGIASEFHEDIFKMFKRLERTNDDGGTGVGLTFVRKIVQRHGGHIWLESEPGKGTTFFFTLAPE
jgi:PAS domain S-box-containing protein